MACRVHAAARTGSGHGTEEALEAVAEGIRTADLSGHHGTTAFTDEVIRRTRTKIEVWSSL